MKLNPSQYNPPDGYCAFADEPVPYTFRRSPFSNLNSCRRLLARMGARITSAWPVYDEVCGTLLHLKSARHCCILLRAAQDFAVPHSQACSMRLRRLYSRPAFIVVLRGFPMFLDQGARSS